MDPTNKPSFCNPTVAPFRIHIIFSRSRREVEMASEVLNLTEEARHMIAQELDVPIAREGSELELPFFGVGTASDEDESLRELEEATMRALYVSAWGWGSMTVNINLSHCTRNSRPPFHFSLLHLLTRLVIPLYPFPFFSLSLDTVNPCTPQNKTDHAHAIRHRAPTRRLALQVPGSQVDDRHRRRQHGCQLSATGPHGHIAAGRRAHGRSAQKGEQISNEFDLSMSTNDSVFGFFVG